MTVNSSFEEAIRRIDVESKKKTGILNLQGIALKTIPKEILKLNKSLNVLWLNNNQISILDYLNGFENLLELRLDGNAIHDLEPIADLKKLSTLVINQNMITSLRNITKLENLIQLNLGSNLISEVSDIKNLINLKYLNLANNHLEDLIPLIRLENLRTLNLNNNNIKFLPLEFVRTFQFEFKDLEDDIYIKNRKTISLKGNKINPEHLGLLKQKGIFGLLKFLEDQEKSGTCQIKEAKLMLLGMPRAGKSSLKKYLLREPFDPDEKSTEKIDLADWKEDDFTFHIWDFGGQEMLYDLHRFFLTDEALYVIVLDASKDEQPDKYLEFLESYAPNAPFYILINKADIPTSSSKIENYNQIKDRYPNTFKGVFDRVSLMQAHENNPHYRPIAEDVRNKILDSLKALPHVLVERPKSYQKVKEEVESYYEKENVPYINSSNYSALCQEVDVNDDDRSILAFLNVLGTVRYINEPNIRNLHIINPEWAIEAAYFLLTNEEIKNKKGVLNLNQLEILIKSKADSKFTYEIFEIDYLLELLTKFRIIHFHNPSKTIYLPTHFGNDQPKQFKEFRDKAYHYFFEFKADIPGYVISALIAAKFDEIQDHLYWNKGAMLEKNNIQILFEQADKRKIDFWIQGEFFQNYFVEIRTILQEILKPLVGLSFEEKISVTDKSKTIEVKRTHLEKTLKRGREDYEDLDEDIIVNAREVLGTYFTKTEIRNLTQNFHGPTNFYNSDTINFWGTEWGRTFANIEDSDLKDDLINNLDDFEKAPEQEKKSLAKKIGDGLKNILSTAKDEATKEVVKEALPKIGEKLGEWSQQIDFNQLGELLK